MSFTKQIREYSIKNPNTILDVSKVKDTVFSEIPYKTLLKILNRLEIEGVLSPVSKGVYYVGDKVVDEELIVTEYVENGKGMFVGYQLFNEIGISTYQDEKTEIYTNNIQSNQKNIGKYNLKYVDIVFEDNIIDLISLLEIIYVGYSIKECDFISYKKALDVLSHSYSDKYFQRVVKTIRYKFSTIKMLSGLLEQNGIINNCFDIYSFIQ